MKTKTSFYKVVAVCVLLGLGMPLSGRAEDQAAKTSKKIASSAKQKDGPSRSKRTKTSRELRDGVVKGRAITGSHVPQTYRQEGPNVDTARKVSVYDRHDLEKTGNLSVGSSLKRLDPSITLSGTP